VNSDQTFEARNFHARAHVFKHADPKILLRETDVAAARLGGVNSDRERTSAKSRPETKQEKIEAEIAEVRAPVVDFHPKTADIYRQRAADLKATLTSASAERREDAVRAIRELVEKIVIYRRGSYKPVDIEIHEQLAAPLRATEPEGAILGSQEAMVAGTGFEPVTFRL
jgi:hypothetical protein